MTELLEKLREYGFEDVTRRKIRFFVEKGLIPSPIGNRGGAKYAEDHLLRILAISKLRKTYWRVVDIKNRLESMSPEDIRQFALTPEPKIPALSAEETDARLRRGISHSQLKLRVVRPQERTAHQRVPLSRIYVSIC
jgi:DNA-binding transcriptional MerR regulator